MSAALAHAPAPDINPGVYDGLPFERYLSGPGVSVSRLKLMRCPARALAEPEEPSAAQHLGTLTHCMLLEPHAAERRFVPTRLARCGTKAWEAAQEEAGGRELVKVAAWDAARRMRDAAWRNPRARMLLDGALTERSIYWRDGATGLLCRARADATNEGHGWGRAIVDLKTADDASRAAFVRDCRRWRYPMQAAFYLRGYPADWFAFITVEKRAPHLTVVRDLDPYSLTRADAQVREALEIYAECVESGNWPGYEDETVSLPEWAFGD